LPNPLQGGIVNAGAAVAARRFVRYVSICVVVDFDLVRRSPALLAIRVALIAVEHLYVVVSHAKSPSRTREPIPLGQSSCGHRTPSNRTARPLVPEATPANPPWRQHIPCRTRFAHCQPSLSPNSTPPRAAGLNWETRALSPPA